MPDRLITGLRAELDAVRPAHPRAAQARYRLAAPQRMPARRPLAGLVMAAAAGGLAVVALATLATGSPNPQVWTVRVTAGLQRLQEPKAEPTPAPPAAEPTPPVIGAPAPEPSPSHPAAPPTQRPQEKPQPTDSGHGGDEHGGGDHGGDHQSPRSSPRPSDSEPPGR